MTITSTETPRLGNPAERRTWQALADQLEPNDLVVSGQRVTDHLKDHEVDFVVGIEGAGIVCIEVKGGEVWHDGDGWRQKRGGHDHKIDPVRQAREACYQPTVNQKAAHNDGGPSFADPAVKVNDSAGVDFISNASQDLVVAVLSYDTVVGNRIGVVPDSSSGLVGRDLQLLQIWVEAIVRRRQVDDRVHSRIYKQPDLFRCFRRRARTGVFACQQPPGFDPPRMQNRVVRPRCVLIH
jgi:hypothetical protein